MTSLKNYTGLFAVIALVALAVPEVLGQRGMRNYNPATEVTVQGTVEEVTQVTRGRGWGGTHLTLKTAGGTLDVHLGPSRFLQANKFEVSKGDHIKVLGSKVQYQGHDALIAREVTKGDQKLTLRDAQGIPKWSGRGQRN
jgi:hypothetical protein